MSPAQCPAATYKDYTGNQHVGDALADCHICPNNTWSNASSVFVSVCSSSFLLRSSLELSDTHSL